MNATNQTDPLQVEFPRFLTIGSIIGLISGFALGTVAHASPHAAFEWLGGVTGPVGAAWTHALMMVVIPLIVSFLIVATAGDGTRAAARLGALTLTLFIAFLVAAAALTVVLGVSLTKWMPTDPDALGLVVGSSTHQLGAASSEGARTGLGLGEWLVALFPSNPIRAAADGDILAVVVVSVLFGLAISRIGPEGKRIVEFVRAVRNATLVLTSWILWALPVAAFALAFGVAAASGFALAGAIGFWIVLLCSFLTLFLALLYPITALFGGVSLLRFARGVWSSQTVAAGTRSSLATLPALMQGGERQLHLPSDVVGLTLPLSVSTFKLNVVISSPLQLIFLTHLFGLSLDPEFVFVFVAVRLLLSFSQPGIPSGTTVFMLPFFLAAGIPVEAYVLLQAVDAIPDILKTVLNVTADMSVAVIAARFADRMGLARKGTRRSVEEVLIPAANRSAAG